MPPLPRSTRPIRPAGPTSPRSPRALLVGTAIAVSGAVLVGAAAAPSPTAAAATDVPSTTVSPRSAPTGTAIAEPYLSGRTVHDGDVTAVAPSRALRLLGRTGDSYLVLVSVDGHERVAEVRPGTAPATYLGGVLDTPRDAVLVSRDGSRLVIAEPGRRGADALTTTVSAYATGGTDGSGTLLGRRLVDGDARVLDARLDRVVLTGSDAHGVHTSLWTPSSGALRRIAGATSYAADLAANRLALYRETSSGSRVCTRTSTLSRPSRPLWRSCGWQVEAFERDGRMALAPLDFDGPGPRLLRLTTPAGRPVVEYLASRRTTSIHLQRRLNDGRVLLRVGGPSSTSYLACELTACARVSPVFGADARD
ncbi:hypothetical protein K8Z61_07680 [Nocardioides sp. TRM66260-LWL]|uniref:hypothetical protein n=1 Tax=Nocardioides sp. TRM66260-LWL TaxID=2874478 RepID=UPI001CC70AE6|nr:hypothetical protein [Nocardioides sp. TRM66260-LWL]MBZ5734374.1 hypothetical protein [Nocardioides sp. TRM66260-LWL]